MSDDKQLQDAWVKLQREKAALLEQQAIACANGTEVRDSDLRRAQIDLALTRLKEARAIRALLAKIETIGE